MLGALAVIVVVHVQATGTLNELQSHNRRLQSDIDRLKSELGDYDKVKAQREELLKQRKSIAAAGGWAAPVRSTCCASCRRSSRRARGPTFDRVAYEEALRRDPNVGFNASLGHPPRLAGELRGEDKKVRIKGIAKSHDDAAEFMKRLNSSVFFSGVRIDNSQINVGSAGTGPAHHLQPQRRGHLLMNELITSC